jgi:hypothetical protein
MFVFKRNLYHDSAEIPPVCTVAGACAANEALKAVSGRHVPCRQWLVFDAAETASADLIPSSANTITHTHSHTAADAEAAIAKAAAIAGDHDDGVASPVAAAPPSASRGVGGVVDSPELGGRLSGATPMPPSSALKPIAGPAVVAPPGDAGVRALVGAAAADAVGDMRLVLAGTGGVGREVLRCWALMGAGGCGSGAAGGSVCVIDGATVGEHDLARGALLRLGDVGTYKASAVVAAVVAAAASRGSGGDGSGGSGMSGGGGSGGIIGGSGGGGIAADATAHTTPAAAELTMWSAHMAWLGRGASPSAASASFSVVGRYPDHRLEGVDAVCCAVDSLSDRRAADDISVRHRWGAVQVECS